MPMHMWGDETVDWKGIDAAAEFIGNYLRKRGRVNVRQTKEKWGQVCVYCSFGWTSIHSITHPGYAYIQYKEGSLLYKLEYLTIVHKLLNIINSIGLVRYHRWLYRRAYKLALKKWPHLAGEILCGADFTEELLGLDPRLVIVRRGKSSEIHWLPDVYEESEDDLNDW